MRSTHSFQAGCRSLQIFQLYGLQELSRVFAKYSTSMFWSHGENGEQSLILDILIWPLAIISQTKYHVTLKKKKNRYYSQLYSDFFIYIFLYFIFGLKTKLHLNKYVKLYNT